MYIETWSVSAGSLWSFDNWVGAYTKLGQEQLAKIDADATADISAALLERLNAAVDALIDRRKNELRNSDDYTLNKFGATLAGSIPFARSWATRELGKDFAQTTLRAFGLGDADKLQKFQKSFQGAFNSKTAMARSMAGTAAEETVRELLKSAAVDGGSEAVHAKPIIGQVISMGMGYHRMRSKMLKMINAAGDKAATLHQGLVVPHVIHLLKPDISAKKPARVETETKEILAEQIESESDSGSEQEEMTAEEMEARLKEAPFGWCGSCDDPFKLGEVMWVVRGEVDMAPAFCDFCSDLEMATSAKGDGQLTAMKYDVLNMTPEESALATWTCQGPSESTSCLDEAEGPVFNTDVPRAECSACSATRCMTCDAVSQSTECRFCCVPWTSAACPLLVVCSKTWYASRTDRDFDADLSEGKIQSRTQSRTLELCNPGGYCGICDLDIALEETAWAYLWTDPMGTLCNFCMENLEVTDPEELKKLGVGLAVEDKIASEDMTNWVCMERTCESRKKTVSDIQVICPECSYRRCCPCVIQKGGSECPNCGEDYGNFENPHVFLRSEPCDRGAKRPLIICTNCGRIHSQSQQFVICEGCTSEGARRSTFCSSCIMNGADEDHSRKCYPEATLRTVDVVPFVPKGRSRFTCHCCQIVFASTVPYASCATDDSIEVCYICFFSIFVNTSAFVIEDTNRSLFTLHLQDRPARLPLAEDVVPSPVITIPDVAYAKEKQTFKDRVAAMAKEKGTRAVLKKSMVEAVHWLTKSHIGPKGAAHMGLMGLSVLPIQYVPWPGLALPAMTQNDFQTEWPDPDADDDMEFVVPHDELQYLPEDDEPAPDDFGLDIDHDLEAEVDRILDGKLEPADGPDANLLDAVDAPPPSPVVDVDGGLLVTDPPLGGMDDLDIDANAVLPDSFFFDPTMLAGPGGFGVGMQAPADPGVVPAPIPLDLANFGTQFDATDGLGDAFGDLGFY